MCGICGVIDFQQGVQAELLQSMVATLHHRGPDDRGVWTSGPAGLGHTRLSIIDLSEAGHQPMTFEEEHAVLAYNGEIYNFQSLRAELQGMGHVFISQTDTEVVLRAWLAWGEAAFERFHGMFAIALWDNRKKQLYLVRDRFGIKPIYYYSRGQYLVFGSEVKALLASERVPRDMDYSALHEYLYYGTPLGGNSFFSGVVKLLPGHFLRFSAEGAHTQAYTSIFEVPTIHDDVATATEKVRDLLDASVKSHLVSDVPVGVFLSGGIDSSAVTAIAARHYGKKLKTYSVGFDFDGGHNELPAAKAVAEHIGTDHHEVHIQGKDMGDMLRRMVHCHDEPFGDEANLPLYLLCEALQGDVKVVLQGDGGDEIFAGYHRYSRLAQMSRYTALGRMALMVKPLLPKRGKLYRGLRTVHSFLHPDPSLRMALLMAQEHPDNPPHRLFSASAREHLAQSDPFARYRACYERFKDLDQVQRMLYTDCAVILPDTYFEKVDKSTMAHSVEVRVPFVDPKLAAYVMGLPSSVKVQGSEKKFLLRKALRGVVPDFILDAPKKGFGVPMSNWLRGPLAGFMQEVLSDPSTQSWGLFDHTAVSQAMSDHIAGRADHGMILKKLVIFCLWKKAYIDNQQQATEQPSLVTS